MTAVRVLLIEDDDDHRFLTRKALREGISDEVAIDEAGDGEEALRFLRDDATDKPHLILLDLRMPRMSGLEMLEHLKTDPGLRAIPVVVLTSSDREEDVEAAYKRGANTYVTKPVGVTGIRDAMREIARFWVALARLPRPPE